MEAYDSSMKIVKYLAKFALVYTIYENVESSNSEIRKISKKIKLKLPFLTNNLNAIKKVKIINNKPINFQGIRIGGLKYFVDTNWVRDFKPPNYKKRMKNVKKETERAKRFLKNFKDLDILACHQPLYGFLDKVTFAQAPKHWKGKHARSKVILGYIKKEQPKYFFCGHIHEGKGKTKIGRTEVYNLGVGGHKIIEF